MTWIEFLALYVGTFFIGCLFVCIPYFLTSLTSTKK